MASGHFVLAFQFDALSSLIKRGGVCLEAEVVVEIGDLNRRRL